MKNDNKKSLSLITFESISRNKTLIKKAFQNNKSNLMTLEKSKVKERLRGALNNLLSSDIALFSLND